MNQTKTDQLHPIMMQGKAVADAAREAHPEVSFARLSNMLQLAADWARVEAWKEAAQSDLPQKDELGEELIGLLRERSGGYANMVAAMSGEAPFQGFYVDPKHSTDITAGLDCDMQTASPAEVRRAADTAAARLLHLISERIGPAPLALITAIVADTALAAVAVNMPEDLQEVEERISSARAILKHSILQDAEALGVEAFPTGWDKDAVVGGALLAIESQENDNATFNAAE